MVVYKTIAIIVYAIAQTVGVIDPDIALKIGVL